MKDYIIISDFDGTITRCDGLYKFIATYAAGDWEKIEKDWSEGKISSKECLIEEFKLVPDLSEELISSFVKTIEIDDSFKDFYKNICDKNIDFCVVSDGVDYFINKILERNNLFGLKIISNHGAFRGESFELTFPNDFTACKNNAGTCKCKIIEDFREKYNQIIYIGDGVSDYCVAEKADKLYAKSKLADYCEERNIKFIPYNSFSDIKI